MSLKEVQNTLENIEDEINKFPDRLEDLVDYPEKFDSNPYDFATLVLQYASTKNMLPFGYYDSHKFDFVINQAKRLNNLRSYEDGGYIHEYEIQDELDIMHWLGYSLEDHIIVNNGFPNINLCIEHEDNLEISMDRKYNIE